MKWIDITEYASKYSTNLHTLRNKIILNEVDFIFDSGKYKIKDSPLEDHSYQHNTAHGGLLAHPDKTIQALRQQLESKIKNHNQLQEKYDDLQNLFQWIEQENKEIKLILQGLNRIDSYMKDIK